MLFTHHDMRQEKCIVFTEWTIAPAIDRTPAELRLPLYQQTSAALRITLDGFRAMVHTFLFMDS